MNLFLGWMLCQKKIRFSLTRFCLSSRSKTAFIYFRPWISHCIFPLTISRSQNMPACAHTHSTHTTPLNLCLLKWSLMRCEQRTTTLSLLFHLPPLSPLRATEADGQSDQQIGVEGEKVTVELMGENEVFFFYFITPSLHPSSCDHSGSRSQGL